MSRDLPPGLVLAIEDQVVRPFLAFRIELPDPVCVWTGTGTIIFKDADGFTRNWLGTGELGSWDTIGEVTDGSAQGLKLALNMIPAEFAADIAAQATRGAVMEAYFGTLDQLWQTVTATKLLNRWRLDDYRITDGGDTIGVEVSGESRAIDQRRPAIIRFTDEHQQRKHPGDLFFQYVARMTEVKILWAKAEPSGVSGSSGAAVGAAIGRLFGSNAN